MKYGSEWFPGVALLGTALVLLIVPPFALIALAVVALAVAAAVVALAAAILASPYLIARTVRHRFAERHGSTERSLPIATTIALAGPTTARSSQ